MRKINRVLAAGALALPLTLGIAGAASAQGQDTTVRVDSQASAQVRGHGSADASSHAAVRVDGRGDHWDHRWHDGRWGFHAVHGHFHQGQHGICFLDHGHVWHVVR